MQAKFVAWYDQAVLDSKGDAFKGAGIPQDQSNFLNTVQSANEAPGARL